MAKSLILLILLSLVSRAQVRDLNLVGADLIDEMVYQWTQKSPFANRTAVALAGVSAPTGLNSVFQTRMENRLYDLLRVNKDIPIELAHCHACSQYVTYSTPEKTIFSRGFDQPEILSQVKKNQSIEFGLHLHFQASGRDLILRATLFRFNPQQTIFWSQVYSASASSRPLLRGAYPLVSWQEAKKRQEDLLRGSDRLETSSRFLFRQFTIEASTEFTTIEPLLFFEQTLDVVLSPRRHRRFSIVGGFTSVQNLFEGWSLGAEYQYLIGRDRPSLSRPDVYVLFGFHHMRIRGPGALPYAAKQFNSESIAAGLTEEPAAAFISWRLGAQAFIKNRLGAMAFIEYVPLFSGSQVIREQNMILPYHGLGLSFLVRW